MRCAFSFSHDSQGEIVQLYSVQCPGVPQQDVVNVQCNAFSLDCSVISATARGFTVEQLFEQLLSGEEVCM